jgi:hypothetical protein
MSVRRKSAITAAKALKKIDSAVQTLSGAATSTTPGIAAKQAEAKKNAEPSDTRSNAERAEDALLTAILGASSIYQSIREIATAASAGVLDTAAPPLLLAAPDGIAKLMKASSEAINMAIEGMRQIPALRSEDAATQGADGGQGAPADHDYPLRDAMEAFEAKLKEIRGVK